MKKQQIETLIEQHLVSSLEGFKLQSNLIYKIADDSILHGIHFGSSAFDSKHLVVTVFIQLLYIPSDTIDLSIGFRLRDKDNKEWWVYNGDTEKEIFSEILEQIQKKGLCYFEDAGNSETFYKKFKRIRNRSIREQEALTLSAIVSNDESYRQEVNNLMKIANAKEYKALNWVKSICQNIRSLEKADYAKRNEIINEWKNYTIKKIKVII